MLKKTLILATAATTIAFGSASAMADHGGIIGALVGGGIGAHIGSHSNDRNGRAIGGVVGAIAGAAIGSSHDRHGSYGYSEGYGYSGGYYPSYSGGYVSSGYYPSYSTGYYGYPSYGTVYVAPRSGRHYRDNRYDRHDGYNRAGHRHWQSNDRRDYRGDGHRGPYQHERRHDVSPG